jgi:hypothetical protein
VRPGYSEPVTLCQKRFIWDALSETFHLRRFI